MFTRNALGALLGAVSIACGSGHAGPTCSSSDTDCMLAHLSIYDNRGNPILLTRIPAGTIKQSQLQTGKGLPTVVDPLSNAVSLTFQSWNSLIGLPLKFTDPNGSIIGGCFRVRLKSQPPGPFGGFAMVAFRSAPDGKTSGDLPIFISPGFEPESGLGEHVIDLYPMAPVTANQEAVAQALGGGGNCTSFGQQYCNPTDGARCGSNSQCHCCWATCSGSRCTCYPCNAACTSRGYQCHQATNTCIFPESGGSCS